MENNKAIVETREAISKDPARLKVEICAKSAERILTPKYESIITKDDTAPPAIKP
jgi:hypothetical protein